MVITSPLHTVVEIHNHVLCRVKKRVGRPLFCIFEWSNIESITSHEYRYKLTVSPLAVELDDGTFSCSVSITSGSKYVLESFASANDNLTVVGRSST